MGHARLEVALNGLVISTAVSFEYKQPQTASFDEELQNFDEDLLPLDSIFIEHDKDEEETLALKKTLLNKVEVIKRGLKEAEAETTEVAVIEEVLVALIERLMNQRQNNAANVYASTVNNPTELTLLHLAASLGYTK